MKNFNLYLGIDKKDLNKKVSEVFDFVEDDVSDDYSYLDEDIPIGEIYFDKGQEGMYAFGTLKNRQEKDTSVSVGVTVPVPDDDKIKIVNIVIKKLNKFKNVIESLKSS